MRRLLKEAMKSRDLDQEAISLSRVCNSIRDEMFNTDFYQFSGSFPTGCEESSVPASLKSLVSSLIYGPNIKDQNVINSQTCLSICQLILFNSKESVSRANTSRRHSRVREPPLPSYVGLNIHTLTRGKKMISQMIYLCLSVSYHRLLEIQEGITKALCHRFCDEMQFVRHNSKQESCVLGLWTISTIILLQLPHKDHFMGQVLVFFSSHLLITLVE